MLQVESTYEFCLLGYWDVRYGNVCDVRIIEVFASHATTSNGLLLKIIHPIHTVPLATVWIFRHQNQRQFES